MREDVAPLSAPAPNAAESATVAKTLLLTGLHNANVAYAVALLESSSIAKEEGRGLLCGLLELGLGEFESRTGEVTNDLDGILQRRLGAGTMWLNVGRSRFEVVGVAFLLAIRKRILDLARAHLSFAETTVELANKHRESIVPNPAIQSKGSVSTLGHCLLTFVYPAFRDLERLQHCYRSFNSSPCGVGANATGARLPIDRKRLRALLGFDELRQHTGDALWQADGPIELMAAIVALLVNLNRLTDDLRYWASPTDSTDAAWIRSLTSSLLAKVPVLASLGKESGDNPQGCVNVAVELCAAFDGAVRAITALTSFVTCCAESAATRQKPEIHTAEQSDLVEVFVTCGGIDFASARKMAREIDRLIAKGEVKLPTLTPEAVDAIAIKNIGRPLNLSVKDLASATGPAQMIGARRGPGSVAPERVVDMITQCRARLVRESLWVSTAGQRLANSESLLLSEARAAAGK
jgi:argininosuccinate lyase